MLEFWDRMTLCPILNVRKSGWHVADSYFVNSLFLEAQSNTTLIVLIAQTFLLMFNQTSFSYTLHLLNTNCLCENLEQVFPLCIYCNTFSSTWRSLEFNQIPKIRDTLERNRTGLSEIAMNFCSHILNILVGLGRHTRSIIIKDVALHDSTYFSCSK